MKILFIHDKDEDYSEGYYRFEYLKFFQSKFKAYDILYTEISNEVLSKFDLIIFGHAFINSIYKRNSILRKFRRVFVLFPFLLSFFKELNIIRKSSKPKIYYSTNDYKDISFKTILSNFLNVNLFITHTKKSIPIFKKQGIKSKIIWNVFTLQRDIEYINFYRNQKKTIDIGFRSNITLKLNNTNLKERIERNKFYKILLNLKNFNKDIKCAEDSRYFLYGDKYSKWISSCSLIAFNESLWETLGPKYFESIVNGSVIIAPKSKFEGLLKPNIHYLAIKNDFSDLDLQINNFLNNYKLRRKILNNSLDLYLKNNLEIQFYDNIKLINFK